MLFFRISLYFLIWVSALNAGTIKDKAEKTIQTAFTGTVHLHMEKITLPNALKHTIEQETRQRFFKDWLYVWHICDGNSILGIGILDNVIGKSMPITFLVIFDTLGNIQKADIVKYRESIGGAVGQVHWLNQFVGMNAKSEYKVDQQIDGISGATISVHSVTRGIRKLALLIAEKKNTWQGGCKE